MENRNTPRTRVLRNGRIVFNHGHSAVACLVTDLSALGARLEVPLGFLCPESFRLDLPGDAKREVEVIWSADQRVGVRFVDGLPRVSRMEAAGSGAMPGGMRAALLRRIAAIEAELALLRSDLLGAGQGPGAETVSDGGVEGGDVPLSGSPAPHRPARRALRIVSPGHNAGAHT